MRCYLPTVTLPDPDELDATDPLRGWRDEFVITDPDLCYLDGNSLGRLPRRTVEAVQGFLLDEWGSQLVTGWDHWLDEAQRVGDLIATTALGAGAGQTLALDTTSVNFYRLCDAALAARPERTTVLSDTANFPTDRYIIDELCARHGKRLVLIDDEAGEGYVTEAMLIERLGVDTALVTMSVVQYRSGALHDVARLTELAHRVGALTVWDASHAVGVVDLRFDDDAVDMAVGCTYKYGNSGPGAPAWMYVAEPLQQSLQVPIQGWFAQRDQFAMGPTFERAEGMRGFRIASPSIIGLRCVEAGFSMIGEAGIAAVAQKAARGTDLMVLLHDAWLAPLGFTLVTPRDPSRRGGHITLHHHDAKQIAAALRTVGNVIPDYREPSSIRLAMSPLATSFREVWDGFTRLRDLVASGAYRDTVVDGGPVT